MSAAKSMVFGVMLSLVLLAPVTTQAETVNYTLENVILDDANAQMFGTFSWTYEVDEFENGVGQFTSLEIPFTSHDHTDLEVEFDVGNSIEITLPGSVHDDGVDITLFLLQPLTPTTGSIIDLERSQYEIGGNGFHTGLFLSGSVIPAGVTNVDDRSLAPETNATALLTIYPNPFNPITTIAFEIPRAEQVSITIFDLGGRLVRTLMSGESVSAGRHEMRWVGEDDRGSAVASGVYLCRMRVGSDENVRRLTLTR